MPPHGPHKINKSQAGKKKSQKDCSTDQETDLKEEGDSALERRYSSLPPSQLQGVIIQQVHNKLLILTCSRNW